MKYAFALAAAAGLAAAQPHVGHAHLHKKQEMSTVTDWTVVTVTDVVTVYGPSPEPTSPAAAPVPVSSAPAAAPVVSSAAPVAPVASSAPEVASQQPAPVVSSAQAPAVPSVQPVESSVAPVVATSAQPKAAQPSSGSSSGSGSGQCTEANPCDQGKMTTYTPGLGACGYTDAPDAPDVVALGMGMFGSGVSNQGPDKPTNPLCNRKIQITNPANGKTAVGVIRDRCPGCTGDTGLDLSPPLWATLNPGNPGDRLPVSWYFLD